MTVLVLNAGSSSLKMDLVDAEARVEIASGQVERIGAVTSLVSFRVGERKPDKATLAAPTHTATLEALLSRLGGARTEAGEALPAVEAVGHRVVHGGERFAESALIDEEVVDAIRDAFDLAPLHNPANLEGIRAAQALFPDVPHVAVFDTAFHQTLPPEAFLYALPNRLYRRHKIRRYGFHGTSHQYVSRRLVELEGLDPATARVVTLHLGNGCSACAVRGGRSVDTSMGMTPLEGLVMGTRSGDLDPSIVFDIVAKEEMGLAEVQTMLNRYSGLLGLSGYAADMRDLLAEADAGDARCRQAVDVFCYRVRSYLGRYNGRPWRARRRRLHGGHRDVCGAGPRPGPRRPRGPRLRARRRGERRRRRHRGAHHDGPRAGVGGADQRGARDRARHAEAGRRRPCLAVCLMSTVARQYDRAARTYDRFWARYVCRTQDLLDGAARIRPGERVLDVGCGTGTFAARLVARHPAQDATGVDVSAGMLAEARRKTAHAPNARFVGGAAPRRSRSPTPPSTSW